MFKLEAGRSLFGSCSSEVLQMDLSPLSLLLCVQCVPWSPCSGWRNCCLSLATGVVGILTWEGRGQGDPCSKHAIVAPAEKEMLVVVNRLMDRVQLVHCWPVVCEQQSTKDSAETGTSNLGVDFSEALKKSPISCLLAYPLQILSGLAFFFCKLGHPSPHLYIWTSFVS